MLCKQASHGHVTTSLLTVSAARMQEWGILRHQPPLLKQAKQEKAPPRRLHPGLLLRLPEPALPTTRPACSQQCARQRLASRRVAASTCDWMGYMPFTPAQGRSRGRDCTLGTSEAMDRIYFCTVCIPPSRVVILRLAAARQGRQQQDSHELLRFLVDGLQTEEEKRMKIQRGALPAAGRRCAVL